MSRRRCKGKTRAGKRCERRGAEWCAQHAAQAAALPDSERPRKKARARGRDDWRPRFLAALAEEVVVLEACRVSGVSQSNAYDERKRNEQFAAAWAQVEEHTVQRMEREGFRRAVDGWIERQEFEIDKETGEQVPTLTVRKFSDTLLIFLLKARRPDVYREQFKHEHTGAHGGVIEVSGVPDLSRLSVQEKRDLIELLEKADADPVS